MSWSLLCPISIPIHLDGLDYTSAHQWLLCQQALDSGDIAQFQRLRAPVDMSTSDTSYQLTASPLLRDRLRYVTQVFTDIPAGKLPPFDKMGLETDVWSRALEWRRAYWQTMAYIDSAEAGAGGNDTRIRETDVPGTGGERD